MLSCGHEARDHPEADAHNAQKFHIPVGIGFGYVGEGAHDMGCQTHPRCDCGGQMGHPGKRHTQGEQMQQDVKASWHSTHGAKINAQPPQYLRGMNDIQPYCPEIRFADVDAYGIVHNAKYIVYMEQARIHWWRQAMGDGTWDWSKVGVLVAHHSIDYVRPVRLGDVLEVQSHIGELGNKSMDVHYELTCGGNVVAKAKTVLVCFDHKTQATIPVPEVWRTALEALKVHSPFIEG